MDKFQREKRDLLLLSYHVLTGIVLTDLFVKGEFKGGLFSFSSGPMLFFVVGLVSIILSIVSVRLAIKNRANKYFFIINCFALAVWCASVFVI
jgi:hypothetical protein